MSIRTDLYPTPTKGNPYGRAHYAMRAVYGVNRPGKTAEDKARGHVPYKKNRRVWDRTEGQWCKV